MDSLFERPGWRAVGVIGTAVLAGGALTWLAASAVSDRLEVDPTATPTSTLSQTPSATSDFLPQTAVPYEVIDGVTVSAYLPAAQAPTPEVWDRVGSGWVLAAFDGGLLAPQRIAPNMIEYGYDEFATPGAHVAYLVSPEREVFEAVNLSGLGLMDVLAWSPGRDAILGKTSPGEQLAAGDEIRVVDLATGSTGGAFSPCPGAQGWVAQAEESDTGWTLVGKCFPADGEVDEVDTPFVIEVALDSTVRSSRLAPLVDPVAVDLRVDGRYLVQLYNNWGTIDNLSDHAISLTVSSLEAPAREIAVPAMPDGKVAYHCAFVDLASTDQTALECQGYLSGEERAVYYLALVHAESATLLPILEWVDNPAYIEDGGFEPGCAVNGVYGMRSFNQTAYGGIGLERWDPTQVIEISNPDAPRVLQCEGWYNYGLLIRGVGGLWYFELEEGGWTEILPAPVVSGAGDDPDRYVAGVTDLGIFVAP